VDLLLQGRSRASARLLFACPQKQEAQENEQGNTKQINKGMDPLAQQRTTT
jgi:hypothetical protein